MSKRILVGMSGGIDSTWAVKKLIERGYAVEGAVLNMHGLSPVLQAENAAKGLGIKLHIIDCRDVFHNTVVRGLVSEYAAGRTPNPCVICNSEVKFKILADFARNAGIDKISTGHYVKVLYNPENKRCEMFCAEDKKKDQSYFLWRVEQSDLEMFENVLDSGDKESVKKELDESGIIHESRESQEICFISDNGRIDFLKSNMSGEEYKRAFSKGNFVDVNGKILGMHEGLARYTPGQRKGLGIALGRPAYVLRLDYEKNEVILGFEEDNVCTDFEICGVKFVSQPPSDNLTAECFARVRHRGRLNPAIVEIAGGQGKVFLKNPEKTVSAGQSAVFYDEYGKVLFGGYIK